MITAGSTSVFRGRNRAYVIKSKNKLLIDSIYKTYATFFPQVASSASSASSGDGGFKMLVVKSKRDGGDGDGDGDGNRAYTLHVEGALNPDHTRRALVRCTTLGAYMTDQTRTMPTDHLLRMLDMLQKQAQDLEGLNWSVPYYALDDILIINDAFFCFMNDDKLFEFDPDTRKMEVTRPISRANAFYAPELLEHGRLHALPYELDYRASFYSLGLLAAFCALLNWDLVSTVAAASDADADADADKTDKDGGARKAGDARNKAQNRKQTYSDSDMAAMLDPIKYSKLYWFVLRCCRADAKRRLCAFV